MRTRWFVVALVPMALMAACGAGGGGGGGAGGAPDNGSPASSGGPGKGGGTVQELYSCTPTTAAFPDPHELALCREMLHRYPAQQ